MLCAKTELLQTEQKWWQIFHYKFIGESECYRILKIGQPLVQLQAWLQLHLCFTSVPICLVLFLTTPHLILDKQRSPTLLRIICMQITSQQSHNSAHGANWATTYTVWQDKIPTHIVQVQPQTRLPAILDNNCFANNDHQWYTCDPVWCKKMKNMSHWEMATGCGACSRSHWLYTRSFPNGAFTEEKAVKCDS